MSSFIVSVLMLSTISLAREVHAATPAWADVTTFGAAGNGVTDDTAAIQNAVDSLGPGAEFGGGGIVYFPKGIYRVSQAIVVRSTPSAPKHNITFQGDGPGSSVLLAAMGFTGTWVASGYTPGVIVFDAGNTTGIKFPTVRDLGIDLRLRQTGIALHFFVAKYVTVEHVRIFGPGVYPPGVAVNFTEGIRLDGGLDPESQFSGFNRISGNYIQRVATGINLVNQVTATFITGNHLTGNRAPFQKAIAVDRLCGGISVVGNEIEDWDVGVYSNGSGVLAIGNRFESNSSAHIQLEKPQAASALYSITLGNVAWGTAPPVVTPHSPNHPDDVVSTFDIQTALDIPFKEVLALGYYASGNKGVTQKKVINTTTGQCTLEFTGGILTGGTC